MSVATVLEAELDETTSMARRKVVSSSRHEVPRLGAFRLRDAATSFSIISVNIVLGMVRKEQ